jgi:hypothetical protein
MLNSNNFTNVHEFDSKLINIFKPLKIYSNNEKEKLFQKLSSEIVNINSKKMIEIILNDIYKPKGGDNFHPENNVDASDILADILSRDYKDILPLIEEQLSDAIQLGICNSGRVTRMLNIWMIFN